MTNYEIIKNMSIEEMTNFFAINTCCEFCSNNNMVCTTKADCLNGMQKYLEQEVE